MIWLIGYLSIGLVVGLIGAIVCSDLIYDEEEAMVGMLSTAVTWPLVFCVLAAFYVHDRLHARREAK